MIDPSMDFRVTVRKSETSGSVVVARGIIDNLGRAEVGIPVHLINKVGIVDTVLTFVQKHKRIRRTWLKNVRHLSINDPIISGSPVTLVFCLRGITVAADPIIHGNASHTRNSLPC